MSILFDPRDARCKSPFGAVTTFAAVDFTFYPRGHAVTGCTLLAHHEFLSLIHISEPTRPY